MACNVNALKVFLAYELIQSRLDLFMIKTPVETKYSEADPRANKMSKKVGGVFLNLILDYF